MTVKILFAAKEKIKKARGISILDLSLWLIITCSENESMPDPWRVKLLRVGKVHIYEYECAIIGPER